MATGYYLLWIMLLLIFSSIYIASNNPFTKNLVAKSEMVTFESANLALDRIEKFTTWLTGLQSAAIAAMGFLIKDCSAREDLIIYGFFSILFFGGSIILSTWLLSSLPSIQQRLRRSDTPTEENDIYMMRIFSFIPFRLGRFAGLIHTYFLIGIVFFALFIFKSLTT